MQIILAKTAGFCFGVDRAVEMVNEASGAEIKPRRWVPSSITAMWSNAFFEAGRARIRFPGAGRAGETVIIRAHGVPEQVQQALLRARRSGAGRNVPVCEKIHTIVKNETQKGRKIIIFGSPAHPEVEAIASFLPGAFDRAEP